MVSMLVYYFYYCCFQSPWTDIELYTLVLQIHNNVDMLMGIKNIYDIEEIIGARESCLHFLNRLIPFFPQTEVLLKLREQRFIKIDVTIIDEISRLAMIRQLDVKTGCTNMIKAKFVRNRTFLDIIPHNYPFLVRMRC